MASQNLTAEQMMEYRAVFSSFDKNGDGAVTAQEFSQVMEELGFKRSEGEVQAMIKTVDTDKNGSLDFDEFVQLIGQIPIKVLTDANLRKAFRSIDSDNSGHLSRDEVQRALKGTRVNLNDKQVDEYIKRVDKNGDGRIDYEEFCAMVRSK